MTYALGQPVRLTFRTYSDAAKTTLADPTTVSLQVKDPTGTVTTYTWAGATVTREGVGVFHWDAPDTTAGFYQFRWVATGAVATSTRAGAFSVDEAFPAALVSLEDAKSGVNKVVTTDDDELQSVIYEASAILLNHPDYRVADVCTVQTYTEDWTYGGDLVTLRHYPVVSVTSVTEYVGGVGTVLAAEPISTATFTAYGYRLNAASGLLTRVSGGYPTCYLGDVRVVYTAGTGAIPWDVRDATLKLVKHLWRDQRGYDNEPANPFNPEAPAFTETAHLIPWEVEEALAAYKRSPSIA